ncbi:hypothetical protein ACFQT0_20420 [Hymenobacter humi]|uniref:Uncharacterized protein n=1 Tax=Hymenobacter humi TaxID=1411620 RepID=A0ABW2U9H5_9BACT
MELADGTRLRPTGNVWKTYLPKQKDGEVLSISYALAPPSTSNYEDFQNVTLSCLEALVMRCGNE